MRKWCGPARPGLTGHAGKITPSYSDGLFSRSSQATIFPIPPTACHNLLLLWSQERRTRSVQRQAEMRRCGVGPARPSGKGTPAFRLCAAYHRLAHFCISTQKDIPGASATLLLQPRTEICWRLSVSLPTRARIQL